MIIQIQKHQEINYYQVVDYICRYMVDHRHGGVLDVPKNHVWCMTTDQWKHIFDWSHRYKTNIRYSSGQVKIK